MFSEEKCFELKEKVMIILFKMGTGNINIMSVKWNIAQSLSRMQRFYVWLMEQSPKYIKGEK